MIKNGDEVSYAIITINSHGYLVRHGHQYKFIASVTRDKIRFSPATDVIINHDDLNTMIRDPRSKDGTSYIMVYPAGKTEAEVNKILQPQMVEWLKRHRNVYEILTKNMEEMLVAAQNGADDHICQPMRN